MQEKGEGSDGQEGQEEKEMSGGRRKPPPLMQLIPSLPSFLPPPLPPNDIIMRVEDHRTSRGRPNGILRSYEDEERVTN